jgi:hypothetical protein
MSEVDVLFRSSIGRYWYRLVGFLPFFSTPGLLEDIVLGSLREQGGRWTMGAQGDDWVSHRSVARCANVCADVDRQDQEMWRDRAALTGSKTRQRQRIMA